MVAVLETDNLRTSSGVHGCVPRIQELGGRPWYPMERVVK